MKTVDMIVKTRHLFTMEGDGVGYLENTAMIIDRGRIIDFVPTDAAEDSYRAEEVLALFDHAVLPGLIDAHTHVDICIARGLAQDTDNWMFYGLQPFENAMVQEDIDASVKLGIMEAIKAGTTTIGEFSIGIEPACKFINQSGILLKRYGLWRSVSIIRENCTNSMKTKGKGVWRIILPCTTSGMIKIMGESKFSSVRRERIL